MDSLIWATENFAVNKNAKAPIFQVADVGVVMDLLEFVPVLTEKIQESK